MTRREPVDSDGVGTARKSEALDRLQFFDEASAFTGLVSVDVDGVTFLVSTADGGVGRSLFRKRGRSEMRLVRRALLVLETTEHPAQTLMLDIGANIGTATIAGAAHFERVFAFEPEPTNLRLLRATAVLNGLEERVRAFEVAVSDVDGDVRLLVASARSGSHEIEVAAAEQRESRWGATVGVKAVALDSLVEEGTIPVDEVGLVWMDVQGHEGHVLAGATRLMERGVPIALELFPRLLGKHDGLDRLRAAIEDNYTHVVNLRKVRPRAKGDPRYDAIPVDSLGAYISELEDGHTDVLALRV